MDSRTAVVAGQLVSLAGLAWPGRARWSLPLPVRAAATAATAAGAAVTGAAAVAQRSQLTPHVEPPPGAQLRTSGVYRLSRHPMYTGLLLAGTGAAVLRRRVEPLVAAAALAGVLHVKAGMEERWLRVRFGPDYEAYAARTPKVLGVPRG